MRMAYSLAILIGLSVSVANDGLNTLVEEASKLKKDKSTLKEVKTISQDSLNYYTGFKIDNPFSAHMFSMLTDGDSIPVGLKKWTSLILKNKFQDAMKELPKVSLKVTKEFDFKFRIMKTYLYWRLSHHHIFLKEWFSVAASNKSNSDRTFKILDEYLTPHAGKFIAKIPVLLTTDQKEQLTSKKVNSSFAKELNHVISLNSGELAFEALSTMPEGHALEIPMGYKSAFFLAKKGRIGDAGKILKKRVEKAVMASGSIETLSKYYLLIARLLYQARAYSAARNYYEKIPNGDPRYLQAQSELTWVYLHLNETDILRGKLETLTSDLYDNQFSPESYVVRAISNLNLCRYGKVKEDLDRFIISNKKWAKRIDKGFKDRSYELAISSNYFLNRSERAVQNILNEIKNVEQFNWEDSNKSYWGNYRLHLSALHKVAANDLERKYKTQYKLLKNKLKAAILKMRFVKIEYLDQLQSLAKSQRPQEELKGEKALSDEQIKSAELVFPYDGVYWPDEVFKLRSATDSSCTSLKG